MTEEDLEIHRKFRRGQIVVGRELAVIVGLPGDDTGDDDKVPEGHLELWFGQRDGATPITWTVPAEYYEPCEEARRVMH